MGSFYLVMFVLPLLIIMAAYLLSRKRLNDE